MNNKVAGALCASLTLLTLLNLFLFNSAVAAGTQAWSEFSPAPPLDSAEHITGVLRSGPLAYQKELKPGDIKSSDVVFITTSSATADRILRYTTAGWTELYKGEVNTADILRLSPTYAKGDNTLFFAKTNSIRPISFSTDNGLTWKTQATTPPGASILYSSGLMTLHNAQAFLWGDIDRIFKTTDNGTTWKAIPCPIGKVTSIKRAGNNDIIASGIDSGGKIRVARSKYINNATWGDDWEVIAVPVPISSYAIDTGSHFTLTYPARDGIIAFGPTTAGDSGIWMWYINPPSASWTRIDKGNPLNQGIGGTNANNSVGTAEEGNGVSYFLDESSIVRLRGKVEFTDRILGPPGVTFTGMTSAFVSPPTPTSGPVTLWCLGDNDNDARSEKIYIYTDALNRAVSGVSVSAISSSSAIVSWSPLPTAANYAVFVSRKKQTNYYTAFSDDGISVKYTEGAPTAGLSGLSPDTEYYVSVWASAPVTSFSGGATFTTLGRTGADSSK